MITVHNINGTSNRTPNDGSSTWKDFWEKKKSKSFSTCSCSGCSSNAEVGAHVQKDGSNTDNYWYIVPLCRSCNKKVTSFDVRENDLVRVTNND